MEAHQTIDASQWKIEAIVQWCHERDRERGVVSDLLLEKENMKKGKKEKSSHKIAAICVRLLAG